MEGEKLWQAIVAELEITLSRPTFKTWFGQSKFASLHKEQDHQVLTISCPSSFIKERIETHYTGQISQLAEAINGLPTNIVIHIKQRDDMHSLEASGPLFDGDNMEDKASGLEQSQKKAQLNPLYTFDSFVVGASNNLAYTAGQAVAKASGRIHNPLFLYGGVGTGKTHLMHAIGNAILYSHPEANVLYVSCEQFTNDLIESLKSKTTEKFRNRYRKLTVLIVDDIQFLSKSEYAQEEFFNTFNTLYNANHQIIIASDRLPEEIPKLADRLTSRFQGGVIVDVQPPDLEMRMAILQAKAAEFGASLPYDVANFIADTIRSNTRELEGSLKRVIAMASMKNEPITLQLAKQVLGLNNRELKRRITPRQVVEAVAKGFNVPMRDLTGSKRRHEIVVARQVAMYLLRNRLQLQYERIADVLGGKDHTTIMYGVSKVENLMENDGDIRGRVEDVLDRINKT